MTDKPTEETIEIMYRESVRQYDLIINSLDRLNTKAIGIMTFNGTLLSLFSLSVVQFINPHHQINSQFFLYGVIVSYILIIISIICAACSYRVVRVISIDSKKLHSDYYTESKQKVLDQLCSNISDDCEKNQKIADTKSKFINYSLLFSISGIIAICLSLIYGFYMV